MERFNKVLQQFVDNQLIFGKYTPCIYQILQVGDTDQEILIRPDLGRVSIIRGHRSSDKKTVLYNDSIQWCWKHDMMSFQGAGRISPDRKIVVLDNFSQLLTEEGYFLQSTVRDIDLTREELHEIFRNVSTLVNRCNNIIGEYNETYKPDPEILRYQQLAGI